VTGRVAKSSLSDFVLEPIRELGVLFGQSPIAVVFNDHELRIKYTNAAFRGLHTSKSSFLDMAPGVAPGPEAQALGLPGECLCGVPGVAAWGATPCSRSRMIAAWRWLAAAGRPRMLSASRAASRC
jgi:hypothetical protein